MGVPFRPQATTSIEFPGQIAQQQTPSYHLPNRNRSTLFAEVRKALLKASIPAEFSGGALYCEGPLVIRRSEGEGAGLSLEGPLSEQYHRVQQVIYAQYHVC